MCFWVSPSPPLDRWVSCDSFTMILCYFAPWARYSFHGMQRVFVCWSYPCSLPVEIRIRNFFQCCVRQSRVEDLLAHGRVKDQMFRPNCRQLRFRLRLTFSETEIPERSSKNERGPSLKISHPQLPAEILRNRIAAKLSFCSNIYLQTFTWKGLRRQLSLFLTLAGIVVLYGRLLTRYAI